MSRSSHHRTPQPGCTRVRTALATRPISAISAVFAVSVIAAVAYLPVADAQESPRGDNVGSARRRCGTDEGDRRLLASDKGYGERRGAIERFTSEWIARRAASAEGSRTGTVIIPVVVHVVYRNAAENLSAAQIQSQIAVLNQDFRRTNADAASVPAPFSPRAADARIQFALAVRDPNCAATTGITRTSTATTAFHEATDDVKHAATGGHDAWPRDRYLNLWVAQNVLDSTGAALLGYARFPGGAANHDGVVVATDAFGTTGTLQPSFNRGRSATHEIGHWLNLQHIWADECLNCATACPTACGGTDNVSDTPNQSGCRFGCPSFPALSCSNGPDGDLFMNYMDYVDDACMFMFTAGQSARMDATLYGVRATLLGSDGLLPPPPVAGADLFSQDRPDDPGDEPNATSTSFYESEDLWVRPDGDGIAHQEHANPLYRAAGLANHVYVRVRNRGCSAAPAATVKLYWAKASTALAWPAPWDGSVTTPALMGSLIGTATTAAIAGGGFRVLDFPWSPPDPAAYASFGADRSHFCLLARIETASSAPFGMTFPEGADLGTNVRSNNNIVWKNVSVDGGSGSRIAAVTVGNFAASPIEAKLVVRGPTDPAELAIFDWGEVRIDLGSALFARWTAAGAAGTAVRVEGQELIVEAPGAAIAGLRFGPRELQTVQLRFVPRQPPRARAAAYKLALEEYTVDLSGDHFLGGQQFVLKTDTRSEVTPGVTPGVTDSPAAGGAWWKVYWWLLLLLLLACVVAAWVGSTRRRAGARR